ALHVWDLTTGREVANIAKMEIFPRNMTLSDDGTRLAAMSNRSGWQIWDTSGKGQPKPIGDSKGGPPTPESFGSTWRFSPDGKVLLQISSDRTERLPKPVFVKWDADTGAEIKRVKDVALPANQFVPSEQIVVSPDFKLAALPLMSG